MESKKDNSLDTDVVEKVFTDNELGKQYLAKIVSNVLGISEDEILRNFTFIYPVDDSSQVTLKRNDEIINIKINY